MFFVFEGIDGSGKTTQAKLLAEHISGKLHKQVTLVREPGGTDLGERIRDLVLGESKEPLDPPTEIFLFMAARSHLAHRRILPALRRGQIIISDRFIWSTAVYQGAAAGYDVREILRMRKLAAPGLQATRTFLIDVDPDLAFRRVKNPNRMEGKGIQFQRRVRAGFLALARNPANRFVVIDGSGSVKDVHSRVVSSLPERGWSRCSSL